MEINGKKFNKLEQWQVDYLKENYQQKLTDLQNHLGLCDETIYRLMDALGIKRDRLHKISIPHTEEAENLMRNPYISHVKIADKYGCTPEAVAKRRQLLGVTVRKNMSSTRLEDAIARILDDLDLVYVYEKQIGNWSIDFYLGCKYCIDVNGTWAHSKDKIVERDERKTDWLRENGYKYLVVKESEMDSAIEKVKQFTLGFPRQ
jgi:very-short-patch-repair endonuclease